MNYGRRGSQARAHQVNAAGRKIKNKITAIVAMIVLTCAGLAAVVGICAAMGVWKGIIDTAPEMDTSDAAPSSYYSTVFANDGKTILTTLVASGSNRKYVTIEEVPQNLQDAFVAIEDERFYEHNGIDVFGIFRAAISGVNNVLKGGSFDQGASTITQQLIKNNVLTTWTSETSFIEKFQRKVQEQYMAVELEKKVTKEWILENYMNTINLGSNTLGVQAASSRYFGKDVSELTLSECAVLAGITKNPTAYDPINYPENNELRREKVLSCMLEQGYITQAEYDEAVSDTNVYARIALHVEEYNASNEDTYDSYFTDACIDDVYKDLVASGYSESDATRLIYQGGLKIYSTQDVEIQQICDEEVNNLANYECTSKYSFTLYFQVELPDGTIKAYTDNTMLTYLRNSKADDDISLNYGTEDACYAAISDYEHEVLNETGGTMVDGSEQVYIYLEPEVALTVMDQSTGEVKAIVGGRGDKKGNRTWNRAVDTLNQPGSTFKVLACYAEALDLGIKSLDSTVVDEELNIDGWEVNNNDHTYGGVTTVRTGIVKSINVVAIKNMIDLVDAIGWDEIFSYLTGTNGFGFTTLTEDDKSLTTALGGITDGVSNVELTAAFAAIANDGYYLEPKFYTKVVDSEGNVILDISRTQEKHRVISEETAYLLTSTMEDVVRLGSGQIASFSDTMAEAGKTGTTNLNRDALFAGYTPYYTLAVWGGNDDNTEQDTIYYPRYLWKAIMGRIHEGLEDAVFEVPEGVEKLTICNESGKVAVSGACTDTYTEYYNSEYAPTETCDLHTAVTICTESGKLANVFCPQTELRGYDAGTEPTETCTLHTAPAAADGTADTAGAETADEAAADGTADSTTP